MSPKSHSPCANDPITFCLDAHVSPSHAAGSTELPPLFTVATLCFLVSLQSAKNWQRSRWPTAKKTHRAVSLACFSSTWSKSCDNFCTQLYIYINYINQCKTRSCVTLCHTTEQVPRFRDACLQFHSTCSSDHGLESFTNHVLCQWAEW